MKRSVAAIPVIAAACAFALYAVTASRTVSFGDAGELITAAAGLGVAHPPGYPLWTLLAKGALALPIGEPAFRVALFSAACAAAACALTASWVHRATASAAAALGAAGLLAVTDVVWASATVAEVYALHLLLVLALLEASRRIGIAPDDRENAASGGRGAIVIGATILGVALAHHPTIVLAIPAAAVLAWPGRKRVGGPVIAFAAFVAVAIPSVAYLSLLPRAAAHPEASWGTLRTLRDLVAHASADLYRSYDLGWAGMLRPEAWRSLVAALVGGTGLLGVVAAGWGAIRTWRSSGEGRGVGDDNRRREVKALILLIAPSCLFALRYGVEDVDAYLIPAVAAIAILAGIGLAALSAPSRQVVVSIAAMAVIAVPVVRNFPQRNLRTITAAADYGRDILATVPPDGILIADGDDTFALAYLQRVLGERTDIEIYDRDGFVLRDVNDEPTDMALSAESDEERRRKLLFRKVGESVLAPSPRPVLFMSLPDMPLPPVIRVDVYGILFRASPASVPPIDDSAVRERYRDAEITAQARRLGGPFAAAVAASYPLMRAEAALTRGDRVRAIAASDEAIAVAPRSETVRNTAGTIYARLELYDRAIAEFEAALRSKPSSGRARANLEAARRLKAR